MARKKGNPLSGKFRDPPQEGNASVPEPAKQDTDQIKLTDQGDAPAEPIEAPAGPVPADGPAPEQADQGDAPDQPTEAPAEPAPADGPAPEQADQGDAPDQPTEAPAGPVPANGPTPEQADQGDAPDQPAEAPAGPVPADGLAPEQADQGDAPDQPAEAPADPVPADAPAQKQADQGDAPAEPAEAPAGPVPADAPAPEQADQGDTPDQPAEAPAEPAPADGPAPEQADQGDAPAEPAEAPAEPVAADTPAPQHPEARFVKLADIKPLSGTFVKDVPREDYTELLDSIKTHGLEKPIILRRDESGGFQLVDGFHRCEALKQAGITITPKGVDDMRAAYAFTAYQNSALDELLADRAALASLAGSLSITSADVLEVLRALPDDLSPERRAVVEKVLSLVGKVNYFWGGKSYVIGWDSRWGTLQKVTSPGSSTSGTYRPYGLDCSGFLDWALRNAGLHSDGHWYIGRNLTAVSQADAMPGDFALYPDASHVGMVVGRNSAGKLLVCHCSYGMNNVVVTEFSASGFTAVGRQPLVPR